jgi:hypothetical protein
MQLREPLAACAMMIAGCREPRPIAASAEALAPTAATTSVAATATASVASAPAVAVQPPAPSHWFAMTDEASGGSSCQFGGVVRAVDAAFTARHRGSLKRAVRIELSGPDGCHPVALTGVRTSAKVGPEPLPWSERPCAAVILGAPTGYVLPFGVNDAVCGSVRFFSVGTEGTTEVVVLDGKGELLLAFAAPMPRAASPFPGWSFTPGPERTRHPPDEGHQLVEYDVVITHGRARWTVQAGAPPSRLDDGDAFFRAQATAYRAQGSFPPWSALQGEEGVGFALVREKKP